MVLGVGRDVKHNIALGECGRFPIYIDMYVRVIKYWIKLLHMDNNRYPKQCLSMLQRHDQSGRHNWATQVRHILCSFGFGYAWAMQDVGNQALFVSEFKRRLLDSFRQDWHASLTSYPEYCEYHPEIIQASYIGYINARELRRALCLLRCCKLPLNGICRFGERIVDPFCKQCDGQHVEDLCHFVLSCPRYVQLRKKYIPGYYSRFPSNFKVELLCKTMTDKLALKVALYINEALKTRATK